MTANGIIPFQKTQKRNEKCMLPRVAYYIYSAEGDKKYGKGMINKKF